MTDQDILTIYQTALGRSEIAALRAVFDAGYYEALGNNNPSGAPDASLSQNPPTGEVPVQTL